MLRNADPTTADGRERAQEVIDWINERTTVSAELRREAEKVRRRLVEEASTRDVDFSPLWERPVSQLRWLWEKNEQAGNAIIDLAKRAGPKIVDAWVSRAETAERHIGTEAILEREAVKAAWPHMNAEERAEARRRGVAPEGPDPRRVQAPGGAEVDDTPAPSDPRRVQAPGGPEAGTAGAEGEAQPDRDRQAVEDALVQQGADPSDPATQALIDEVVGEEEATDPFVGVPQDHRAPGTPDPLQGPVEVSRPGESATRGQPIYRQSDIDNPFGWSTTRIADLQDRMVKAGLLSKGEFRRGWFDEATGAAYGAALGFANQRGMNQWVALDELAQQRDEEIAEEAAGFVPDLDLPPDPASLRSRARETLIGIGRRPSEIDEEEIDEMAAVMSGEFKRARQVEEQRQRAMHEAAVSAEFGRDVDPDLAGLEQVDPISRFDEWFHSDEGFGGEIETRDTSAKVARAGQNFERGISSMRQQVRSGGA